MGCGLSSIDRVLCCHSTDVFSKLEKQMLALYFFMWPEVRIQTSAPTPKGLRAEKRVWRHSLCSVPAIITSEPQHEVTVLRRLVSPNCNDATDFVTNWTDMAHCLSQEDLLTAAPSETLDLGTKRLC